MKKKKLSSLVLTDTIAKTDSFLCIASGVAQRLQWKSVLDNLQISGRNLLLKSNVPVSNTSYIIKQYNLADTNLKQGEPFSIMLKGVLGEGKSNFSIYNSGGNTFLGDLKDNKDGTYSVAGTWNAGSSNNDHIVIYASPNAGGGVTSSIEWITLVRGNKPLKDWSPAWEDLQFK